MDSRLYRHEQKSFFSFEGMERGLCLWDVGDMTSMPLFDRASRSVVAKSKHFCLQGKQLNARAFILSLDVARHSAERGGFFEILSKYDLQYFFKI